MKKIIPRYAIVILMITFSLNALVYSGTQFLTANFYHYDISVGIDHKIPFLSIFILPYVMAYAQWVIGYIVIAGESKDYCYKVLSGVIIAKLICGLIFIIFPTTMFRPRPVTNDIFSALVSFIYSADAPTNLFPSLHCMESWICFRGCMPMTHVGKTYKTGMFIMTILVFLSTVFIKQHSVIDIAGGMLVAEIGLAAGRFLWNKHKEKSK